MGATENKTLCIDGKAMKEELLKLGYKLENLDIEMGFSRSYLSYALSKGRMPLRTALTLKRITGIDAMAYLKSESEIAESSNMYNIDKQKLRTIISDLGMNMSQASREIGLSSCYLSHCAAEGKISKSSAKALSLAFGIEIEEYIAKDEQEEVKEPEPEENNEKEEINEQGEINLPNIELNDEFWKKLWMTIYHAVYEAVHKAWNEPINIEKER